MIKSQNQTTKKQKFIEVQVNQLQVLYHGAKASHIEYDTVRADILLMVSKKTKD